MVQRTVDLPYHNGRSFSSEQRESRASCTRSQASYAASPASSRHGSREVATSKETSEEGLWFGRDHEVDPELHGTGGLRAFSDIGFAPTGDGSVSHGAVFIMWNGALLWWRSGKQPSPTLSTAEAELVEAIEAFTLGDSVDTMVSEHEQGYIKSLYIVNQAAVALLGEGATSWRTRHLKVRAAALRWRLTRLDWRACFIPGAIQVADLGTKPLAQQRMQELKVLLGMGHAVKETNAPEIAVETVRDDLEKKKDAMHQEITVAKLKVALFVGILAAEMTGAEAAQSHEDTEEETGVRFMMILYTILVMLITLSLQKIFERLCSWFESSRGFTLRLSVSGGAAEEAYGGSRTSRRRMREGKSHHGRHVTCAMLQGGEDRGLLRLKGTPTPTCMDDLRRGIPRQNLRRRHPKSDLIYFHASTCSGRHQFLRHPEVERRRLCKPLEDTSFLVEMKLRTMRDTLEVLFTPEMEDIVTARNPCLRRDKVTVLDLLVMRDSNHVRADYQRRRRRRTRWVPTRSTRPSLEGATTSLEAVWHCARLEPSFSARCVATALPLTHGEDERCME